jgi:hypothetical protein
MTTTVQQASWEDPEPEEGGRYTGILIAVGLFVLACVVACIVGVASDGTQTDQDKRSAISACQNAVKDLLKRRQLLRSRMALTRKAWVRGTSPAG